ncbi:MAG: copper-binding protein, partial [Thaumarchaeota archaeon]|nr:copper-binding protein [Nitrososphaerota archaeon]
MTSLLRGFGLLAILIVAMGTLPALGQIIEPIVVKTDKQSYGSGETIVISGEVRELISQTPVTIKVIAPNGNLVTVQQIDVGSDMMFSIEITAGGAMKFDGTYTIAVQYGVAARTAETTFEFTTGQVSIPKSSGPMVDVKGTDFSVDFSITGGQLQGIDIDEEGKSLIIRIDATDDGELTITLPNGLIRAEGEDFFVLVDGEEVDYDVTETSTGSILTISFFAGTEEIEIIGTWIIPEFG